MPRTKLTEKYSRKPVPPVNALSALLKHHKAYYGITDDDLARELGTSRKTVSTKLNQQPDAWNIGELRRYCDILRCPLQVALSQIGGLQP